MATRLKGEGRSGGVVMSMTKDGLKYSETYEFLVETDDINTGRREVLDTSGLPVLYQSVSVGGPAICNQISADRHPLNPLWWLVKASFDSDINEGDNGGTLAENSGQPITAWKSKGKVRFQRYDEFSTKDANDKAYVNSVGEPFQDGIAIPRTIGVIDFAQFEPATTTLEEIMDRNEVMNSDSFRGRDPKNFLLTVLSADRGKYFNTEAWIVYYSIKYKRDTWIKKQFDVGSLYKNLLFDLVPYEIKGSRSYGSLDGDGNPVNGLDSEGQPVPGGTPAIIEFEPYPAIAFTGLLRLI